MTRVHDPYSGRLATQCVECHQHDEVVAISACAWCGETVCTGCRGEHARECHDEECMCAPCIERRVAAAEARADALRDEGGIDDAL